MNKEELIELKKPVVRDSIVIALEGDTNDGDYVQNSIKISPDELKRAVNALTLATKDWDNREENEDIPEDDYCFVDDVRLYGEAGSCHTVYILSITYFSKENDCSYLLDLDKVLEYCSK